MTASLAHRIGRFLERRGRKAFTLRTLPPATDEALDETALGKAGGFSLHACVATGAKERKKLERLSAHLRQQRPLPLCAQRRDTPPRRCLRSGTEGPLSFLYPVILRFAFSSATAWAEETAVYGMMFAVYLGASLGVRERAHTRITLVVDALPRTLQVACIVPADALWFGFVVFLAVQSIEYTRLLFEVTYITPGLGIEPRWVQIVLPAALVLMLFRIAQVYWHCGRGGWKGLPL